jgi:ACT domain-containing protein
MTSKNISRTNNKKPLQISDTDQNTILETIYAGGIPHIVIKDTLKISLMNFYKYLDQNPKFKDQFLKAQEVGIKTLVEKMLAIFDVEDPKLEPADLLFIREKKDFLKFLAPRLSSYFQEKQNVNVKQDTTLNISWQDTSDIKEIEGIVEEIEKPSS